jgi:hypothetical protein
MWIHLLSVSCQKYILTFFNYKYSYTTDWHQVVAGQKFAQCESTQCLIFPPSILLPFQSLLFVGFYVDIPYWTAESACSVWNSNISVRNTSVRNWVKPWVIVPLEGLGTFKKFSDLTRTRTSNLPACSIVSQPSALSHFGIWVTNLSSTNIRSCCR